MKRSRVWRAPFLFTFLVFAPVVLLHAQAPTKIFVASFGNDANDGSRGSPKRNFQAAHDAIAAGGEIVALDTAGYGALAISKSVIVTVPAGITGLITVSSQDSTAITVNAPSARVALRGLTIENVGSFAGGGGTGAGIAVSDVGTLAVSDCTIQGFNGYGINDTQTSGGALLLNRCTVRDSAIGCQITAFNAVQLSCDQCQFLACRGTGLYLAGPVRAVVTNSEAAACGAYGFYAERDTFAHFQNCSASNNTTAGFYAYLQFGSSSPRITLQNCSAASNGTGFIATGNGPVLVTLQGCALNNNAYGINATGPSTTVRLDGCVITNNFIKGIDVAGAASVLSRGNNTLAGNPSNDSVGVYSAE